MTRDALVAEMREKPHLHAPPPSLAPLLEELAVTVRARGHLTLAELRRIAWFKSYRRRELVEENSEEQVAFVTARAFGHPADSEEFRVQLLTVLRGVRIPMASAILAWAFPERWGVIDRLAWAKLSVHELVRPNSSPFQSHHWGTYIEVIRSLADELDMNPQQIDFWLYSHGGGRYGAVQ